MNSKGVSVRLPILIGLGLLAASGTAQAQRIFDEWPVRTNAGPDALLRGAEAVYWNPAGISTRGYRAQVMVTDQRTPDAIGVGGFAAAGAWRLDETTTIAAGYQHVGIDDIGETSESPLPDEGASPTFSIAEDQIYVSAAYTIGPSLSAGAGARYDRSNESGVYESTTALTAGVLYAPTITVLSAFSPAVAGSLTARQGGIRWSGGVDVALPKLNEVTTRVGYGARGGDGMPAAEHRVGATAVWRDAFTITVGAMSGSGGGERGWEPTLGASLRVSRYELGVLRESLANDFGAAYSFRLRLGID